MSVIEKMSILGIRSFGPDEQNKQVIEFFKPLTLILGPNGSGKTTIIECLRYMTTGDMPPNSIKGGSFVHDPKIAGETEVKGQVRLQLTDVLGRRLIATRNLLVSQKQKKIQMKTLEGNIVKYSANGEKSSLSSKCTEIDKEMVSSLGVSKAILNSVIFCHQEESSWPLSEGKALKTKFDEIFAATRYIKALEEIRKIRNDKMGDIKVYKAQVDILKENRRLADEFKENHQRQETRLAACRDEISSFDNELKPVMEKIADINQKEYEIAKLQADLESDKKLLQKNESDFLGLQKAIKNLFNGSKQDLKQEMHIFSEVVAQKEVQLQQTKERYSEVESENGILLKKRSKLQEELGKLKAEHKQHEERVHTRDVKLSELSKQLGLGDMAAELGEPLRDNQVESVFRNWKQKINTTKQALKNAKTKYESDETALQAKVDEVRHMKAQKEEKKNSSIDKIEKNNATLRNINAELSQVDSLAIRQDDVLEELKDAEAELAALEKSVDVEHVKRKIVKFQGQKKELEGELQQLNQEMNQLQNESKLRTEIDLVMKEKGSKQETIDKISSRRKDTVINLLGSMPERNSQDVVKAMIGSLEKDIYTVGKELEEKKSQLSKCETYKKVRTKELAEKEELMKSYQNKIFDVCGNQNFDEGFDSLEKTLKELQDEKGALTGSLYLYNKYVEKLSTRKPCCPLCTREFGQVEEAQQLKQDLQRKLQLVPSQLSKKEKSIDEHQKRLNSMLELKPLKENVKKMSEEDIPELKKAIDDLVLKVEGLSCDVVHIGEVLETKRHNLKTANDILPDLTMLDQHQREIMKSERRLSTLTCQLGSRDISRTMEHVADEQKSLNVKIESIRNEIEASQKCLADHSDKVQHLRGQVNDLKAEKINIAGRLQKKNAMEEQLHALSDENVELTSLIKELKSEIINLEKEIQELAAEKKEVEKKKEQELEKIRNEINEDQKEIETIEKLTKDIKRYINGGKENELFNHENKISSLVEAIQQKTAELSRLDGEKDELNKEITMQQVKYREYEDNMRLINIKEEMALLTTKCKTLRDRIGNFDYRTLLIEKKKLTEQEKKLNKDRNECEGRQTELANQVAQLAAKLQDKVFKDAEKKHREMVVHLRTTDLACEDLNKYYIALDRAVMRYHQMKMDEINKIVRDLWIKTYAGNDIDYIEIRSNEDETESGLEKSRRVYNYKVVMVKADTAVDMRGRCSAGQKVLASLIIRLALAETFCLNCGILALDEPTTNLDRDNISSLAKALVEIVQSRSEQRNFQLIIITHDEDFIELLGRSETVDHYYRVSKDSNACSRLSKCCVSEMA